MQETVVDFLSALGSVSMRSMNSFTACSVGAFFAVDGRKADKVWKLMDELVEAVKILHPRMYTTFIDKVQDL